MVGIGQRGPSSFNPPPASSARGTPRPTRPEVRPSFNPPPASSARGTRRGRSTSAGAGFNPPPASSARGTARAGLRRAACSFQPTPRFVSEGNPLRAAGRPRRGVSTHPPLRQRGEPSAPGDPIEASCFNPPPASSARGTRLRLPRPELAPFQPTPRFVSEGNRRGGRRSGLSCFNPPPASSARGTRMSAGPAEPVVVVSTHPPLRQRGERLSVVCGSIWMPRFNPPPASSARGTGERPGRRPIRVTFQPTPRFVSEGNATLRPPAADRFQPTPRFVSEGNPARGRGRSRGRFQPTPRFVSEGN